MLNSSHKAKRDLFTKMSSIRNTDGGLVVQRNYTYDKLGRPVTRQTLRSGGAMNETFDYNDRSESARRLAGRLDKSAAFAPKGRGVDGATPSQLIHATRTVGDSFDYAYDNIGNRVTAQEVNSGATSDVAYVTNDLNQYTQIDTNGNDFTPEYDADGNQTLIQTETGIWRVTYNVQNRAVRFENESDGTVITCDYDYMGRRVFKKVEKDGVVTAHERYLYRGYLQIASLDMMEGQNQALINAYVWDPTQPVATRPLAIFYKGVAYYYGWDLTKNITEIFSLSARLQIDYVYTPFGQVRENGIIPQSIQWSSEYHDAETGLVYYNYRYYNPRDGRWTRRDPMDESESLITLYLFVSNNVIIGYDELGELFSQNQEPCCSKCEEYIEKKKTIYAQEIARMNEKGCDLKIVCSSISSEGATGGSRYGTIKITIDCKTGATQPMDSPEDTFGHELVHAQDRCDGRLGFFNFCKTVICSEVRAYTVGGCKNKVGPELIECLKRRVPTKSTAGSCWFKNQTEIGDLINEDFRRSCYEQ